MSRPTATVSSGCISPRMIRSIYVPAADLLDGLVSQDTIEGHIVLIGTSAVGLQDVKTTPLDPVMPGVEIHAQILESILTKSGAVGAGLGHRRRVDRHHAARPHHHRGGAAVQPRDFDVVRNGDSRAAGRHFMVLLRQPAHPDRRHLSADLERRDLSHAGVLKLFPRADRSAGRSARPSASICRRRWWRSSRSRRKSSCSAASSAP